jgi:hypothetical protein
MGLNHGTGAARSQAFVGREDSQHSSAHAGNMNRAHESAAKSNDIKSRIAKSRLDISRSKEFKLHELAMLSLSPIVRSIQRWWLQRAERHYLICADVEQQRAREAQMNVAYYQKQAALARSARH